ncbi:MAG: hypothetical protein A2091_02190 [Desulfuromonadales bacterium GWD2_61_12]|nr:MAG: hypothetical protein A2091_02190 [Desulfuromonadales bacterium GWD2_61_12]HAD03521.1 CAP domain-containing protein [Desulfuromonas sp.]HBT83236.1 CAP domain-containing protein [Desulfuromonas sp.]
MNWTIKILCFFLLAFAGASPVLAQSDLERAVWAEMNLARTRPALYTDLLAQRRVHYQGTTYRPPGASFGLKSREGVVAVAEAAAALRRQRPLPPLAWHDGLAAAARELARRQSRNGELGHGSGTMEMRVRIERYGRWQETIGENIAYGPDQGREVVLQLLIDDDVPGRGHRKNILTEAFRAVGVGCVPHPQFATVCVIDFAGGFAALPPAEQSSGRENHGK